MAGLHDGSLPRSRFPRARDAGRNATRSSRRRGSSSSASPSRSTSGRAHRFSNGCTSARRGRRTCGGGDLWDAGVVVTSSRGPRPQPADRGVRGRRHPALRRARAGSRRPSAPSGGFRAPAYAPVQLAGKTVCVVGAGGIGREVGRLCAALGMRVVGTRAQSRPRRATASSRFGARTGCPTCSRTATSWWSAASGPRRPRTSSAGTPFAAMKTGRRSSTSRAARS